MRSVIVLIGVLLLSGCANVPEIVVMKNTKTGEIAQCKHDPWGSIRKLDVVSCVDGYEKSGWKAMNMPEQ